MIRYVAINTWCPFFPQLDINTYTVKKVEFIKATKTLVYFNGRYYTKKCKDYQIFARRKTAVDYLINHLYEREERAMRYIEKYKDELQSIAAKLKDTKQPNDS